MTLTKRVLQLRRNRQKYKEIHKETLPAEIVIALAICVVIGTRCKEWCTKTRKWQLSRAFSFSSLRPGLVYSLLLALLLNPLISSAAPLTFTEHVLPDPPYYGRIAGLQSADLDSDGDMDILCGDPLFYDIFCYRNDGTGNFTKVMIDSNAPGDPRAFDIGDIDDDGDPDFVATMGNVATNSIVWYRNNGSLSFTRNNIASTNGGSLGCDIADLDSDGDQDVVAGDYSQSTVHWYDNNGSEVFTEKNVYSGSNWPPTELKVVDIDGDGDKDVINTTNNWNEVSLLRNNGSQTFTKEVIDNNVPAVVTVDVGDVDGDGIVDVVSGARSGGVVKWYKNNGVGVFTTYSVGNAGYVQDISIADMNGGDNHKDLVVTTYSNGTVLWFDNDATETFTQRTVGSIGYAYQASANDFDNDGVTDVAASSVGSDGSSWFESSGADTTPPTVQSYNPADNATGVSPSANLVITFTEAVTKQSGNITIKKTSDDSTVETIDVTSGQVTGGGTDTITINPTSDFASLTGYYVLIDATCFDDLSSNSFAGISDKTVWNFTTADVEPPVISSLSPTDGATGVALDANLVANFNEAVVKGSGNITIKKTSDDSTVETIDVTSGQVTGGGTDTITINPTSDFASLTGYYVLIDATCFDDTSGNSYSGISSTTTWNFTTGDFTNPTITDYSPLDNATNVAVDVNLVMTFNEDVSAVAAKNIVLKKGSDDSTVETIATTSAQVNIVSNVVTINPSANLDEQTDYYIQVDSGAFIDASSNPYGGISDTTTWNFTTGDFTNPTVSGFSPTDNMTGVAVGSNLIITFNEAVVNGSSNITIKKTADDSTVETIDVTSGQVTGGGTDTITINPTSDFASLTGYYVLIDATCFDDTSGNSYSGISSTTTWNFTTADIENPAVLSFSPLDNSAGVAVSASLVITFTENVIAGAGNIIIYKSSDNSIHEIINIASGKISGFGTKTIVVNPGINFDNGVSYYVKIDSSTFTDSSGNPYTGINNSTTWNFTTVSLPGDPPSSSPSSPSSTYSKKGYSSRYLAQSDETQEAQSEQETDDQQEKEKEDKKKEDTPKSYDLRIRITVNGEPLRHTKVTLYSDVKTAVTDNNGYANFNNVPYGAHKIKFISNGNTYEREVKVAGAKEKLNISINFEESGDNIYWLWALAFFILAIATAAFLAIKNKKKNA